MIETVSRLSAVALVAVLAGCSALGPVQTNYDDLPGSGEKMARGPGLINAGHYDPDMNAFLVYSDNPSKKPLLDRQDVIGHQSAREAPAPSVPATSSNPPTGAETTPRPTPPPAATAPTHTPADTATPAEYQQFEQFQRYQQFRQLPANAPQKQQFEQWQQWQQYQQWRRSQPH